jgi:outer membrane protein assembly factor BamB
MSSVSYPGISAPSVEGGIVYLHRWGDSDHPSVPHYSPALIGLNADTGAQVFLTTHIGQGYSGSRPTISGDAVFAAGGYGGGFYAYRLNGLSRWSLAVFFASSPPAADESYVYGFGGIEESLLVVDRTTGALAAEISAPSSVSPLLSDLQTVMLGGQGDALALLLTNQTAATPWSLVSFDIAGEKVSWERNGNFRGNPAVSNGVIAIAELNALRFLDQNSGEEIWSWPATSVNNNVVLTDNYAFVNANGGIHAIDLHTRQSVWFTAGLNGELALDAGLLVVSNPQGVYAFAVVPEPGFRILIGVALFTMTSCRLRRRVPLLTLPSSAAL